MVSDIVRPLCSFPGKLKNKSNVNSIILVVYIGLFIEISIL